MEQLARKTYRHGNVPNAMRAAVRAILDEGGAPAVGLRETARRTGVSPTAAYRHFASKEELLASVAAEGFQELSAAMEAAMNEPDRLLGLGLAYFDFALKKRGLFRLMFGPILAERAKYPLLKEAAAEAFRTLGAAQAAAGKPHEDEHDAMAAWGLIHGLSSLFIDGLVPQRSIELMAKEIIGNASRQSPLRELRARAGPSPHLRERRNSQDGDWRGAAHITGLRLEADAPTDSVAGTAAKPAGLMAMGSLQALGAGVGPPAQVGFFVIDPYLAFSKAIAQGQSRQADNCNNEYPSRRDIAAVRRDRAANECGPFLYLPCVSGAPANML